MKPLLVIFGITGDLSRRKLIPALTSIVESGEVDDFEIVGVSRRAVELETLVGERLSDQTRLISMDLANLDDYKKLQNQLSVSSGRPVLIYLSVPPLAVTQIVRHLGKAGFAAPNVKLLLEKPFGVDQASALAMIDEIAAYFDDSNVYRIDHYLAKEMAQNIVAFRARNALFARTWNSQFIEKIEVVASEKIGIEGRAEFYEQTGALRDVLQGHLMQLLSLVLMEIPDELNWSRVPDLRTEALTSIRLTDPRESVRAQYESYRDEVGNQNSMIETFVSTTIWSDDERWSGVPMRLTAGKALADKTTEIAVHFRKSHDAQANRLVFQIQPDESVKIALFTKRPGYLRELEPRELTFSYPEDTVLPEAYEQVLVDAMRDQKSVFASSEEILESWRILQPLLDAWDMNLTPLSIYKSGSQIDDISQ